MTWQAERPLRVLVVCTANQCRSPMAERLLARRLADAGVDAQVRSAGFLSGGVPAADGAVAALDRLGLDLHDHRSQRIDESLLDEADVVLTMEGTHVVDIVTTWTGRGGRAVTLHAAVDGLGLLEPGTPRNPGQIRAWAEQVHASSGNAVFDRRLDVPDPMGRSRRAFRSSAADIDARLQRLVQGWTASTDG